jgi:histidyl-tRNA synthetase
MKYCLSIAKTIRETSKHSVIVYPTPGKLKRQLDYANALNAAYAIVVGSDEIQSETCTIKNLLSGKQEQVSLTELTKYLP